MLPITAYEPWSSTALCDTLLVHPLCNFDHDNADGVNKEIYFCPITALLTPPSERRTGAATPPDVIAARKAAGVATCKGQRYAPIL